MSVTLYGIPNCDTVKKARKWLDAKNVRFHFHDYKKEGVDSGKLAAWVEEAGWETVLNRRGTTFRNLPELEKQGLDAAKAVKVMADHPSCIKRPVVETPSGLLVGFSEAEWEAAF